MHKRLLAIVALVMTFALFGVTGATAVENETFGVTPSPEDVGENERRSFEIPLEVGETFEDALRIYNRTDQSLELSIYAADAEAGLDGAISVGFRGSDPEGVGSWIELGVDSLTLPPRGEDIVSFRVNVRSADPSPDLGAIVVENTAAEMTTDLAQRLNVVVRTLPPNSPTASERARPIFLRSPWIIVAILGLVLAAVLIWLGARRARKPHDTITEPGELTQPESKQETPDSSRPKLHRLGSAPGKEPRDLGEDLTAVLSRFEGSISEAPEPDDDDRLPPLDLQLEGEGEDEDDSEEEDEALQRSRKQEPKNSKKLDYIPLDEL